MWDRDVEGAQMIDDMVIRVLARSLAQKEALLASAAPIPDRGMLTLQVQTLRDALASAGGDVQAGVPRTLH
jgi:hypothetical protein